MEGSPGLQQATLRGTQRVLIHDLLSSGCSILGLPPVRRLLRAHRQRCMFRCTCSCMYMVRCTFGPGHQAQGAQERGARSTMGAQEVAVN